MDGKSSVRITKRSSRQASGPQRGATDTTAGPSAVRRKVVISPPTHRRQRLVIEPADTNRLEVTKPTDGATIWQPFCVVNGTGVKGTKVWLKSGDFRATSMCGPTGLFRFLDVPLAKGVNVVLLGMSGKQQPLVRLAVKLGEPFLVGKRVDPVTKEKFKTGDDVVRCAKDKTYTLKSTWIEWGACPICNGHRYWGPSDPVFYAPRGGK